MSPPPRTLEPQQNADYVLLYGISLRITKYTAGFLRLQYRNMKSLPDYVTTLTSPMNRSRVP
jgi:hypothetical protein